MKIASNTLHCVDGTFLLYELFRLDARSSGIVVDNTLEYQIQGSQDQYPASPVFRMRLVTGPITV